MNAFSETGTHRAIDTILHPDTFEISQQQVLGWRMSHSTRTPYYVLAATYRAYAPDIDKIITVLRNGIQEKKADIIKYASDYSYVAECREYVDLYEKTLVMIQETSRERWNQQKERERKLAEIDVLSQDRINRAKERDEYIRSVHIGTSGLTGDEPDA